MHPILARGGRLALYLGLWIFVGGAAGGAAGRAGAVRLAAGDLVRAAAGARLRVRLPVRAGTCRASMPLAVTASARIVVTALDVPRSSRARCGSGRALWMQVLARRGWLTIPSRGFAGWTRCSSASAFLLYLLSLAVSYLLAAFEQSREAERRALRGQVLAREAELRAAARADRSALPLQQPALDQRADHGGSRRRRGGCACCWRTFFARAWRSARRIGLRWRGSWRWRAVPRGRAVRFGERLAGRHPIRGRRRRVPGAAADPAAAGRERRHARHRARRSKAGTVRVRAPRERPAV